jgi:hypothetical protein
LDYKPKWAYIAYSSLEEKYKLGHFPEGYSDSIYLRFKFMGRERLELSRGAASPHFECGASTNSAIHP